METYTRQQLHDLVWSGRMRYVAQKLGLSDNGLRKHCAKRLPLPPQGYWNKLRAGHKVKTAPLPSRPPRISDTISIAKWDYHENNRRLMEVDPVAPTFDVRVSRPRWRRN
jgi:hypothetical protein